MLATCERSFFPSMRKIGQMRSFGVSVVSHTSRRDQSERRLRRRRGAGKPGSGGGGVFPPARLMRSLRRGPGFSLGQDLSHRSPASNGAASYHLRCPGARNSALHGFAELSLLAEALLPHFHVEMEMALVRGVGFRAKHGAEEVAGLVVQIDDELGRSPRRF